MKDNDVILKAKNISKQYRLGLVGTGTISHDLNRWWSKLRGKEDPYLKVGDSNDRSTKGSSQYVWALQDINFEVQRGEVLGIIGKNGAGKSTLLKILSKVTGPTTGEIKTKGRIASLLEVGTGFHGEMTGRENVYLNGAILGMSKKEITSKIDDIIEFSGCQRYIDTPVKRYSSGMTVRLAFAVAAFLEPEILVIDEVLAVGDAEFQKKAIGKMQDISRGEGRTVLFVSHNMAAVKNLCTRGIVLEHGKVVFEGNVEYAINKYISTGLNHDYEIEHIKERSGSGVAIFSNFHIENSLGEVIDTVITGTNVTLVFTIKTNSVEINNLDVGFSLHNIYGDLLTVLYSSYQDVKFNFNQKDYYTVKCTLENFNFAAGKIEVMGRIIENKVESDWVKVPIGVLHIEKGDFYNTGSLGFEEKSEILIKGKWQ